MKCFYHNDLDGQCAGFFVHQRYPECQMIPVDYRDSLPLKEIAWNEQVYIVDFSFPLDEMRALLNITDRVVWIDHHVTAIEKLKSISPVVEGIRREGRAACFLTWAWMYVPRCDLEDQFNRYSDSAAPAFVKLIEDYDIWRFEMGDSTRNFVSGMGLYNTNPEADIWDQLFWHPEKIDEIAKEGEIVERYKRNFYEHIVSQYSFFTDWEGYRCVCCNQRAPSSLFDSVKEPFDIMISFIFDGKQWVVSLFSKDGKVDVSEIAKKYGGGGHRGAAGFQCEKLPFVKES